MVKNNNEGIGFSGVLPVHTFSQWLQALDEAENEFETSHKKAVQMKHIETLESSEKNGIQWQQENC